MTVTGIRAPQRSGGPAATGLCTALRGRGALWTLEFPPEIHVPDVVRRIVAGGVIVSPPGAYIRLACEVVRKACL